MALAHFAANQYCRAHSAVFSLIGEDQSDENDNNLCKNFHELKEDDAKQMEDWILDPKLKVSEGKREVPWIWRVDEVSAQADNDDDIEAGM